MLRTLGTWYSRRIVNVNVNIVAAGVLALGPVLLAVRGVEWALAHGYTVPLQVSHKLLISLTTFVVDLVADLSIYYLLHWLANYAGRSKQIRKLSGGDEHKIEQFSAAASNIADAAVESTPFIRDATKVQLQRLVLSPLLYGIWLGTQFVLMAFAKLPAVTATAIGFAAGVLTTRVLHTFWMLGEQEGQRRRLTDVLDGRICGKCGLDVRALATDVTTCPACSQALLRRVTSGVEKPQASLIEASPAAGGQVRTSHASQAQSARAATRS
jgi:hypothetical protein